MVQKKSYRSLQQRPANIVCQQSPQSSSYLSSRFVSLLMHLFSFSELPKDVQANMAVLGWTKKIWDKDGEADTEDMDWSTYGRICFCVYLCWQNVILCMHPLLWTALCFLYGRCRWPPHLTPDNLSIDELSPKQQEAAKKLGYTQSTLITVCLFLDVPTYCVGLSCVTDISGHSSCLFFSLITLAFLILLPTETWDK